MTNHPHASQPSEKHSIQNATASFSPQGMLIAALTLVVAIVLAAPHSLLVFITVVALVVMVCLLGEVSVTRLFTRSLFVLPIAGAMALLAPLRYLGANSEALNLTGAPVAETTNAASTALSSSLAQAYAQGAPLMLQLIITPWLCSLVILALSAICPMNNLLYAFERLHLPQALVMLLSFIHRYVDLMRSELRTLRRALISRAPTISRRKQVLLYGNIAGSLIVRTQARGERIHTAMLARGFTGQFPRVNHQRFGRSDAMLLAVVSLLGIAFSLV